MLVSSPMVRIYSLYNSVENSLNVTEPSAGSQAIQLFRGLVSRNEFRICQKFKSGIISQRTLGWDPKVLLRLGQPCGALAVSSTTEILE